MTLFDAEIGKKVQKSGLECVRIVARGYKLLGKTEESKKALQKQKQDDYEAIQEQTQADEQRPRYMLRSQKVFAGPTEPQEPRYSFRSRVAPGTVPEDTDGHPTEFGKATLTASQTTTSEHRTDVVPVTSKTVQKQIGKGGESKLSTWLTLENSLRKGQGKGPISIQRAPAGVLDSVGMPM